MAGAVTVGGFLYGLPVGQINIGPFTLAANSGNNLQVVSVTLASGANTITVPATWPVGCIIIPNTSNATGLILKGVTGDTGVAIAPSVPTVLSFPAAPPTTFVLTAASLFGTITDVVFF